MSTPGESVAGTPEPDQLREWYSSEIWGQRSQDDDALFEVMSLQIFQAGLKWSMVLARRDAFRIAFKDWKVEAVASMGPDTVDLMLQDPSIIRNRKKIEACIENARTIKDLQDQHGSFCQWFYAGQRGDDLASLQKELRATFKFIGPEIARMWLYASGRLLQPDHGH